MRHQPIFFMTLPITLLINSVSSFGTHLHTSAWTQRGTRNLVVQHSTVKLDDEFEFDLDIFGASDAPDITSLNGGIADHPDYLVGPIQLEEVEHDTTTLTALVLEADGSVTYMETDGPAPTQFHGEWSSDGQDFWMILSRIFDGKFDTAYTIARIYHGEVESRSEVYTTMSGEVRIDDNPVGYFKVLVLDDELISADNLSPIEVAK